MPHRDPMTPAMFHILLATADQARHGYAIMQEVQERTDGAVDLGSGTLYRAIGRLLDEGLIAPVSSADDRRRPYRITAAGRSAASAEARSLAQSVTWAKRAKLLREEQ